MTPPVFPFVVGSGRSGTTVLRAMLDSHPELAVPPESHFVAAMARAGYGQGDAFDTPAFLRDLAANRWYRRWELPDEQVRAAVTAAAPQGLADAVRAVYREYAATRGKPRYGDKTPPYVLNLPLLGGLFPEARFVHVVRDGRDVALSLLDVEFGPDSFPEAVVWWRRSVSRGRAAGARLGPGRYREIRYEELVDDPEEVLRALCPFLGLDFDPAMLRYHERADEVVANVGRPEQHAGVRNAPTRGVRDWRRSTTEEQQQAFEALAGGLRAELGYEAGPPPSRGTWLRARGSVAGGELARLARRAVKRARGER